VLNYLSRYVFRTAISNARILDMDQSHVTFRWKDRSKSVWRIERLSGVEFLRRFLQHVLPQGFHRVRYYGLWNPSKREQSNRAWVLLILATPADGTQTPRLVGFSDPLSGLTEQSDQPLDQVFDHGAAKPRCPNCGSCRTRFLGDYPRSGVP
jgi:Putative transposase